MKNVLIYGANGYTGKLICEVAHQQGLQPVIAGRNEDAIAAIARQYQWNYRIFDLAAVEHILPNLAGIDVVLHCAGPFRFTAKNMMHACLESGVHYLDITGEIEVFALAAGLSEQAKAKKIMLMPGTGFDVVPTDCLALQLKEKMPDATTLELAFVNLGGAVSHGTAMSMTAKLGEGGACRTNGQLRKEPLGKIGKTITIDNKDYFVMSIPWGDVFTSFYTTGIGNMRAFTGVPRRIYYLLKGQVIFNPLLRTEWFRDRLRKKIRQRPEGPSTEKRAASKSLIWGEAANRKGEKLTLHFWVPNGYSLTALTAVDIAVRVLKNDWKPGYQTPAGCYGSNLIDPYLIKE